MDLETAPLLQVSPSRIKVFLKCAKLYDYTYNQQLKPKAERKTYFDKGNYFHELSHVYYELIKAGTKPGSDYAIAAISQRIQNDLAKLEKPDAQTLLVYNSISARMIRFIKEQSQRIDRGIEVLEVEAELEYVVNEAYSLFGFADLVFKKDGTDRIRDHKTGEKAWDKADARNSFQLLFYAVVWFMMQEVVPYAEISYINTRDYVKKQAPFADAFSHHEVLFSRRELEIAYEQICALIEKMLKSDPIPHYDKHCAYCPFQAPCFAERKGIDSKPLISSNYTHRDSRHGRSFTENNSDDDTTDRIDFS